MNRSLNKRILWLACFVLSLLSFNYVNAQSSYQITGNVTWSSNQVFNVPVVVKSGATLTISAGVNVEILYADVNADGTGDFNLTVENGASLVVNGTLANPVIFKSKETTPLTNHWQGIVLNSGTGTVTLNHLKIQNAVTGLTVNRDVTCNGLIVKNSYSKGLVINSYSSTGTSTYKGIKVDSVMNSGTGIEVKKSGLTLDFVYVRRAAGIGIDLAAGSTTLQKAQLYLNGTGIVNSVANTSLNANEINYSIVANNLKSGIFNNGGYLKMTEDSIARNTYHGILVNGGSIDASKMTVRKNTLRGVLVGGAANVNFLTSTVDSNTSYGFDVTEQALATDAAYATLSGASVGVPKMVVNFCNIYRNNGGLSAVQVRSGRTTAVSSTNPQDDFTKNYYVTTESIDGLFQAALVGSINYWSWQQNSANTINSKFTVVNPAIALSANSGNGSGTMGDIGTATAMPVGGTISAWGSYTVRWTTNDKIPFVKISYINGTGAVVGSEGAILAADNTNITNNLPTASVYVPNTGSYTFNFASIAGGLQQKAFKVVPYDYEGIVITGTGLTSYGYQTFWDNTTSSQGITSINGINPHTTKVINLNSGEPCKITWASDITPVNIYYSRKPKGAGAPAVQLRDAPIMTSASQCILVASNVVGNEYTWIPPTDTATGYNTTTGAVILPGAATEGRIIIVSKAADDADNAGAFTVSGAIDPNDIDDALTADNGYMVRILPTPKVAWNYTDSTSRSMNLTIKDGRFNLNAAVAAAAAAAVPNPVGVKLTGFKRAGAFAFEGVYRLEIGDFIGAFYANGTKCAGYTQVTAIPDGATPSKFINLKIWGDDPSTTAIEGFSAGENIVLKVWRPKWFSNQPGGVLAEYKPVAGGPIIPIDSVVTMWKNLALISLNYQDNDYQVIDSTVFTRSTSFSGTVSNDGNSTQQIILSSGWNLISSYLNINGNNNLNHIGLKAAAVNTTVDDATTSVFADLTSSFVIGKTGSGNVIWPAQGINNISATPVGGANGDWQNTQAYYVKMSTLDTLRIPSRIYQTANPGSTLPIISPQSTPVSLVPGVWNQVAYLRRTELGIGDALVNVLPYIELVKDGAGNVYWPEYSINTITTMRPGQGYLIKTKAGNSVNLYYPANTYLPKQVASKKMSTPEHYVVTANTDNNATIAIKNDILSKYAKVGDEIGIFSANGVLVGSSVYNGENLAVTAWGRENGKEEGFGLTNDEKFDIRVYNKANKTEATFMGVTFDGNSKYAPNATSVVMGVQKVEVAGSIPTSYALSQNYPNPFNPSTMIRFALPSDSKVVVSVYNVVGEKVAELVNRNMNAGYHSVPFNASNLASGIYFYRIEAGKFNAVKKMMLIK